MTNNRRTGVKLVAAFLALSVQAFVLPVAHADSSAALTGTVLGGPAKAAAGVVVHVADPSSGRIYSSTPTAADGSFILRDLPAGSYEVALESGGVLFTVPTPVVLQAGQSRELMLKLDAERSRENAVPVEQAHGLFNNPLSATLIVIGAVVIIGFAVDSSTSDDDEDNASSF